MTGSRNRQAWALWLLAAALLFRAAVPAGWMPDTGQGELRVMLCSGTGPVEVLLQPASGEDGRSLPGDSGHRHDPCPYGLALGKALDIAGFALPLPVQQTGTLLAVPMPAAARQAARRGIRPPARGPPHFA